MTDFTMQNGKIYTETCLLTECLYVQTEAFKVPEKDGESCSFKAAAAHFYNQASLRDLILI